MCNEVKPILHFSSCCVATRIVRYLPSYANLPSVVQKLAFIKNIGVPSGGKLNI